MITYFFLLISNHLIRWIKGDTTWINLDPFKPTFEYFSYCSILLSYCWIFNLDYCCWFQKCQWPFNGHFNWLFKYKSLSVRFKILPEGNLWIWINWHWIIIIITINNRNNIRCLIIRKLIKVRSTCFFRIKFVPRTSWNGLTCWLINVN